MAQRAVDLVAARKALIAERERLLVELGEPIEAPGQMTYGSQAAAATLRLRAAARPRAARPIAASTCRGSRRPCARSTTAPTARAHVRQPDRAPSGSRPSRGRRSASTARASGAAPTAEPGTADPTTEVEAPALVTIDDIRRAAANRLRGVAIRTPLIPFGTAGAGGPRCC